MRNIIYVALLAIAVAFALTLISPEEPEYIAYRATSSDNNNAVRFVGGDHKTMLTGFWYFPKSTINPDTGYPVILLAHGMGLIQGKSLNSFVDAFQSAGYVVVTFDYATFGKSDGFPRHQIRPKSHVADVQAAISMIIQEGKKKGVVDVTRIGLWGTSLGGGHVLMAAAAAASADDDDSSIRAVVSQIPALASGFESVLGSLINNPLESTKGILMVILGLMKYYILWKMNNRITYFPIVGSPGSAALLQNPGDEQGYLGILNPAAVEGSGWKNSATTDSALHLMFSRPLNTVSNITVPVLLIAAEHDSLCPAKYIQMAKERIPNAEIITIPSAGHFDVYTGDELQTMLSAQVKFFNLHLKTN